MRLNVTVSSVVYKNKVKIHYIVHGKNIITQKIYQPPQSRDCLITVSTKKKKLPKHVSKNETKQALSSSQISNPSQTL